jgi:hypothetical protein
MPIISLIVILAVIGLLMWLANTYIPMAEPYKKIMNIVVIVAVVLWLLSVFGVFAGMSGYTVGHLGGYRR